MRQVQEMNIAESECAELRRLLEEKRKLVLRLKQENEDGAQMAKREIEKMSHVLAEARRDVEYATTRADFAENEWFKVKRELQEARELVQLLKAGSEETRQDKELELANALDAASIAESEGDRLMVMLGEARRLVQGLILEKDGETQLTKRQIEEMGQELADTQKYAEHATTRADVAERECAQLKRMLEEEQNLVQRLRLDKDDEVQLAKTQVGETDQELAFARNDAELARKDAHVAEVKRDLKKMEEMKESGWRQVEDRALELANALNASAIATSECAKLKRMLAEEGKTVQRLILEKNEEAELAKRLLEKIFQELANARKDAQYARKDADIAKNEWIKLKGELKEKEQFIIDLKLQILEIRQITMRQVEDITQELEGAQKEAECARYDTEIAKNEWIKAKKELQEKIELVQLLKLECQETKESAMRYVEEKELELADTLDAATSASSSSAVAKDCAVCLNNEKDTAFGCGHMACEECGMMLTTCPICRVEITRRIKLFPG